jgi:anti-anti-sigma factor
MAALPGADGTLCGVGEPSRADRATRCSIHRDGVTLRLVGDIDLGNWAQVGDEVTAGVGSGVVGLDLTGVRYFGAAGVRVVLRGYDARPSGVTRRVTCAPLVLRVLRLSGLTGTDGLLVTEAGQGV